MATGVRICKVCGKEYEYCHTNRRVAGVFRWQDVACSPEHGSIYFARVRESRSGGAATEDVGTTTTYAELLEDDEDELFEDDFDEDEDDDADKAD